jgi:ferredoxin
MYLAPAAVLAGMVALWAMLPPVAAFQYLRMALPFKKRRPENIPGNLYVDESCMDCDACRWIAPDIFQRYGLKSVVRRQPSLPEQKKEAFAAMLACPNGAIRTTRGDPAAKDVLASAFPARLSLGPDLSQVFHAGFHSKIAGCTTPYLIARQVGCVMIDVPR